MLAKVVVDASGQSSMIASRSSYANGTPCCAKPPSGPIGKAAFRDIGRDEGATIVIQTQGKKGWFWYIPLHDDVVSVGIVAAYDYLFKDRGNLDNEAIYFEEVAHCPGVEPRLAKAREWRRSAPPKNIPTACARRPAMAGCWSATPSASSIRSTPRASLLALTSGRMAADAIMDGLRTGDTSGTQLGDWEPEFVRGMDRMRRLVCEFYDGFSFGRFIRKHPHLKGYVTDLLIGDLFKDDVDQVWPPMDAMRRRPAGAIRRRCEVPAD